MTSQFENYRTEPIAFATEALGLTLYPWQRQILQSMVGSAKKKHAVRSGHRCGKSTLACITALWRVCCFPRARVLLTAPTRRQVRDVLWAELSRLVRRSKDCLGGTLGKTPVGAFEFEDGREIFCFEACDLAPVLASAVLDDCGAPEVGDSTPDVTWIVDEASGFDDKVFRAIEGKFQSNEFGRLVDVRTLLISNPTKGAGFFFDAFHKDAAEWERFRVSSEEAAEYADTMPGLSRPEVIAKQIKKYGRDHQFVRVRILAEFPGESAPMVSDHRAGQ